MSRVEEKRGPLTLYEGGVSQSQAPQPKSSQAPASPSQGASGYTNVTRATTHLTGADVIKQAYQVGIVGRSGKSDPRALECAMAVLASAILMTDPTFGKS
jgi:hypothetical protein